MIEKFPVPTGDKRKDLSSANRQEKRQNGNSEHVEQLEIREVVFDGDEILIFDKSQSLSFPLLSR